ncbi:extracellular chitosanase [Lentinula edodes]|uniref:Endo-chitosanase n=1 Tax=Lentinula edodes TaxID=5353 RepID=A0A1Q3E4B0_LENED|nr:extracellular chitosanase [Lentinula edodes]
MGVESAIGMNALVLDEGTSPLDVRPSWRLRASEYRCPSNLRRHNAYLGLARLHPGTTRCCLYNVVIKTHATSRLLIANSNVPLRVSANVADPGNDTSRTPRSTFHRAGRRCLRWVRVRVRSALNKFCDSLLMSQNEVIPTLWQNQALGAPRNYIYLEQYLNPDTCQVPLRIKRTTLISGLRGYKSLSKSSLTGIQRYPSPTRLVRPFNSVVSPQYSAPIPRNLRNSRLMMNRDDSDSESDSSSGSDSDSSSSSNTDNTSIDNDSTSTSGASFVADSSIDVAAVLQLVKSVTSNPVSGANYARRVARSMLSKQIWMSIAMVLMETMTGNQKLSFVDQQNIKGNSLGAIICNNKMFYAIMGDTNGDSPEVIGEASWLMARTCFPADDLNGAKGHDQSDVTYIVFGSLVPGGISEDTSTIDVASLKALGDKTMKAFKLNS